MAPITLACKYAPDTTSISNIFLDKYMPAANGEFVKVYLCLIRMFSDPGMRKPSLDELADILGLTERDINRALKYWESMGLLNVEYADGYPTSITLLPLNDDSRGTGIIPAHHVGTGSAGAEHHSVTISQAKDSAAAPAKKKSDVMIDETFRQISFVAEQLIGIPLSGKDSKVLEYIYYELGFSDELIEYLIEYCVSSGKRSFRYIEKVAISWKDENIVTVSQAKSAHEIHNKKVYSIMKAFGLDDRQPCKPEMDYISKWYDEYGFENEVILEACNRTIQSIHKPSFEYADSILKNWKQKNIHTVSDITNFDTSKPKRTYMTTITVPAKEIVPSAQKTGKFGDFSQRSYDNEELEKKLIGK